VARKADKPEGRRLQRDKAIRLAVRKITASRSFQPAARLRQFLTFVVDQTLHGNSDKLKEYAVAVDVYGKDESFDPRMDPLVRVEARRLRMRLAHYYETEGKFDDIVIQLPKGGYTPTFLFESQRPPHAVARNILSRNSVAVIPFSDDSESGDERPFCSALLHELVRVLGEIGHLVVIASSEGGGRDGQSAAAMTISGNVQRTSGVLRITTHVTDSERGYYVWTGMIEKAAEDRLKAQEEVAKMVADNLPQLIARQHHGLHMGMIEVVNLAAHNLYIQARYHLNQRTEPSLLKAIDLFSQASKEDPRSAEIYAGLANAYNLSAHYGVHAPAEVWTKAVSSAAHALLLDNESSEAHASMGHIKATQDWDWVGAEEEFRRAISLDARNATAHHWYAVSCLAPVGRLLEAMDEIKLAHALDPLSSIFARDIALLYYYYQRNYDLALEQCDKTIELNPYFSPVYWTLGLVQEQRGEEDEALAAFKRAIDLSPPSPRVLGALGGALVRFGRLQEAHSIIRRLGSLAKERYISPFELALIQFNLGNKDEGFTLLAKAFADRCVEVYNLSLDPRFDKVRSDSRFEELYRKLNLSQNHEKLATKPIRQRKRRAT
jgi:serine/threonine-protein kinase